MPRPLRVDYEGAWHHVMNRGAARSAILSSDADKQLLLDCLVEGADRYSVELHGYCLMSTHYHALVRSAASQLSGALRFASGKFTRVKNKRDGRDGPLFRGRFTSVGIAMDAHLLQASRYIHLNPVAAGLITRAEQWPWSSAAAYLGQVKTPNWLHTNPILDMCGPTNSVENYNALLMAGIDPTSCEFYSRLAG